MKKTILITGSTDGLGLATAKALLSQGHQVLLHGRHQAKLDNVVKSLPAASDVETYLADLSKMSEVESLAKAIAKKHSQLDVLINNAGVYMTPNPVNEDGFDIRFTVNTIAPYLLTQRLLPLLGESSRVVNLSSAAQSPVNVKALLGQARLQDLQAYAQSKLALTMWSRHLALTELVGAPSFIAVNPGSLLATKMVKEGFGVGGSDINIGADILVRAALSEEFSNASGKYYDNDAHCFASPHPDALNHQKIDTVVQAINQILGELQ